MKEDLLFPLTILVLVLAIFTLLVQKIRDDENLYPLLKDTFDTFLNEQERSLLLKEFVQDVKTELVLVRETSWLLLTNKHEMLQFLREFSKDTKTELILVVTATGQILSQMIGISFLRRWFRLKKHVIQSAKKLDDQQPPKFAEYLLYFLPKKDRDSVIGDLEEEYRDIYEKFGKRKARFWYYWQVVMSFGPYIVSAIRKLVGLGVVGWIGSAIRRLIG